MNSFLPLFLGLAGTFVFAVSGIELASKKQLDWFGAYLVGLVTAIGGGTIRDILLDVSPFWMQDSSYFIVTGVALLASIVFKQELFKWKGTLFLFDAIGLGLFTIIGISKSMEFGLPFLICIVMGVITGSIGGLIRDVLLNEVPLLLRKDIYAFACVVGGLVYFLCLQLSISLPVTELISSGVIIIIRVIVIRFHLQLPTLKA
jgi:uncharacterized membrane protein YeiH